MVDRDQHPSREDEIRRAVFGQVDLQTAELEIVSSIYDGFAAAITVKGWPRTIALTREYGDAVQLMALIERGRPAIPAADDVCGLIGEAIEGLERAIASTRFDSASKVVFAACVDDFRKVLRAHLPAPDALRVAVADIAAERQRQVDVEGWSEAHDDEHDDYQMARAAGCYAFHASRQDDDDIGMFVSAAVHHGWPWDRAWWKPKSRRADLVRAGALIVAEIERLDRSALQAEQGAK